MRKFIVVTLIPVVLLMAGCGRAPDPEAGSVTIQPVALAPLHSELTYRIEREFAGLVVAAQSTDLGFELSGKIARLEVNEGERVTAGDLLAVLDVELLLDQRRELDAQAQEITANISLNKLNNKRIIDLESRGFASRQRADELNTQRETLLARTAQIQAALQSNQTRINKSQLFAPFDSSVSARFVDQGAVVNAGTPVLQLLESSNAEARVGVPVRLLDSLSVGQAVELMVAGRSTRGQIITLGQNVTRATLTVPVRVALAADTPAIYGDQAYLTLAESINEAGYWVPLEALTEGLRGLWNVYVALPQGDGFVLEARDVRVLHAETERVFVAGALAGDELLVQSGLHRLVPGQQVVRAQDSRAAQASR